MIVIEKKSNMKSSENVKKKKKGHTDWGEKIQAKYREVQTCQFSHDL